MTVISGVLTAPDGSVLPNVSIILKAISTSSQVVVQTESTTVTNSNGAYSISVKVGEYQVSISAYGQPTVSVGNIQIFPDSVNGTLNDFLTTPDEDALTPVIVATVESMRIAAQSAASDAIAARDLAQGYAAHAEAVSDGGATYATTAAGLAATTSGQYFRVPQGTGATSSFIYYLNNAGTALAVADAVGKAAVDAVAAISQGVYDSVGQGPTVINMFDSNRATDGYYVDTLGVQQTNALYFISNYIPAIPAQSYTFSLAVAHIAFYDINKAFISYVAGAAAGISVTSPAGTFYIRFSQTISTGKISQMLVKGTSVPTIYIGFSWRDKHTQDNKTHAQSNELISRLSPLVLNLFDLNRANSGYALSTNGTLTANASYFVTDFIPVEPGLQYTSNTSSGVICYYDVDFVRKSNGTITSNSAFTIPDNIAYIRFQITPLTVLTTLMVVKGTAVPSSYLSFGYPTTAVVNKTSIDVARSVSEATQMVGRNIFDVNRQRAGYSISIANGSQSVSAAYFLTGMLPVTPGDYFVTNYGSNAVVFYDINKLFLSGSSAYSGSANTPIPVPAGAYYVQFQVTPLTRAAALMVTQGSTLPAGYLPFGGVTSALPWQNKKIIFLGDSITYNNLYPPFILAGTGMSQLANYGVSGQSVRTMADSVTSDTIANADFISILGGTNDYGGNRALGSIADAYVGSTIASFYNDVFQVLYKLYSLKPTVRVVFSTPMKRGATSGQAITYPAANGAGFYLEQYVQAIKEVCSLFSVPVCDLFNISGINLYNLSAYTADNLHPNAAGSALHARPMIAAFNAA